MGKGWKDVLRFSAPLALGLFLLVVGWEIFQAAEKAGGAFPLIGAAVVVALLGVCSIVLAFWRPNRTKQK